MKLEKPSISEIHSFIESIKSLGFESTNRWYAESENFSRTLNSDVTLELSIQYTKKSEFKHISATIILHLDWTRRRSTTRFPYGKPVKTLDMNYVNRAIVAADDVQDKIDDLYSFIGRITTDETK